MQTKTKPFSIQVVDETAVGGVAVLRFDPTFDRLPSTKEFINTRALAYQYYKELFKNANKN